MSTPINTFLRDILCGEEISKLEQENRELKLKVQKLSRELERKNVDLNDRISIKTKRVDNEFINDALRDSFDILQRVDPYYQDEGDMYRIWQDEEYWVPEKKSFKSVIPIMGVKDFQRIEDRYDCENYAESLRSRITEEFGITSVGIVGQWGDDPHVFNVVVYADGTAELIEPQEGRFVTEEESTKYNLNNGVIWL